MQMKRGLLLAATVLVTLSAQAQSVFEGCPGIGNAQVQRVRDLNLLKNRDNPPTAADIDPAATLTAVQQPGDDSNRWSTQRAAVFHGYVVDVKPGGKETCNCKATDIAHRDTHIELVSDPSDSAPERRVIVEVSPRWRAKMVSQGVDWSTSTLRNTIKDHWVTVTGWLLFDSEHANQSENTTPGNDGNWRATSWEIHPITSLKIDGQSAVVTTAAAPNVDRLAGRVTQVDPTGTSFEMISAGAVRSLSVDMAAMPAAKRLSVGDVADVEAMKLPLSPTLSKVTAITIHIYSPTKPVIAVVLLASFLALAGLAKLLIGGRPLGELIKGIDGRYSNSKFQMVLWFGVLIATYLAAVVLRIIGSNWLVVGGVDIPSNLLMLSGLSAIAFAGAKVITSSNLTKQPFTALTKTVAAPRQQAHSGTAIGTAVEGQTQPRVSPSRRGTATTIASFPADLVNDDYGVLSLARFQIMVITFVAVAIYLARIITFFSKVPLSGTIMLPDVDTTILAAFGLGQGAYLTNKVVSPES
jgi:hypothetical protein